MHKTISHIYALIALILITGCTASPIVESLQLSETYNYHYPVWSPDGNKIAFYRTAIDSSESPSIWIYAFDTEQLSYVTAAESVSTFSWLVDSKTLIYGQDGEIWRYDFGLERVNLTQNIPMALYNPLVAPNGNLIAVKSYQNGQDDFWIFDITGNNPRNLSENSDLQFVNIFSWSQDSSQIAVSAYSPATVPIMSISLDGTVRALYDTQLNNATRWSPTSNQLAFAGAFVAGERFDIYLMDENFNLRNLTNTPQIAENNPTWSPNAQYIAYLDSGELAVINLNNGSSQLITKVVDCAVGFQITWASNSERLAFDCADKQNTDIWIINRDGSQAANLTGT